ncbi:MAG TPA: ribonuclease HI family protein [Spirochaetota bacterium]|nr:ribonuclease HI family protein [Spirochaetota bacterium]HQL82397.1 ribonuclease HI family protein [Spirochaetota bacterium]
MLMSIDRVLKLIEEGKSLEKIAEMANCHVEDVVGVIEEARTLINKHDKQVVRKKVILKKNADNPDVEVDAEDMGGDERAAIFDGAELSTIPLGSSLTMYVDGASSGNPGPAGIGILIYDHDDRQVAKVSSYIGRRTNNFAEYSALIRALKIAIYFKTKSLKIRTDSEFVVKQINGEYKVKHEQIKKLFDQATRLIRSIDKFKIEYIPRAQNEKADYLAKKAVQ